MTNTGESAGFRGLPDHVQEIVLEGLRSEIREAESSIREAEKAQPVDAYLLSSLRNDVQWANKLRDRLTSGKI